MDKGPKSSQALLSVPNMGVRLSRLFNFFLTKLIETGTTGQITHRIMRKKMYNF